LVIPQIFIWTGALLRMARSAFAWLDDAP
jgi:hypothetical protein